MYVCKYIYIYIYMIMDEMLDPRNNFATFANTLESQKLFVQLDILFTGTVKETRRQENLSVPV